MTNSVLPTDSQERKEIPMARGLLDYFPAALAEVARVSKLGNDKHNPGQELHWSRGKSTDHADTIMRHLVDRGTIDPEDKQRHSAKVAWRALALLQEELEAAGAVPGRGSRFPEPSLIEPGDEVEVTEQFEARRRGAVSPGMRGVVLKLRDSEYPYGVQLAGVHSTYWMRDKDIRVIA